MKKIVPLSGRLICMPTRPSVWPGRWCSVMPWQKSKLRSSKVFQFLFVKQQCQSSRFADRKNDHKK